MKVYSVWFRLLGLELGLVALSLGLTGCVDGLVPVPPQSNMSDPTNGGATYIGSAACRACHPGVDAVHRLHGHSHILTKLAGAEPVFPSTARQAGVPNPPDGKEWSDITYVLGGFHWKANFLDSDGFLMTDGVDGVNTQWNLEFLANGTVPGFVSYEPDQASPKPYSYGCFRCHTTGPSRSGKQDSLEGIQGTWAEPGVQCEACHGPGSRHPSDPTGGTIYVNSDAAFCGSCHARGNDVDVVPASGGFIRNYEQYQELLASPHARLRCVTCHQSHRSTVYDAENAIINTCQDCHPDQNMALHEGKVFARGDYAEFLSCVSCHMPYATKSASAAPPDVAGPLGRIGDVKTHIWRIDTGEVDFSAMFTADGKRVRKDSAGQAAVTVDFVCLRCHNDVGNAFSLTVRSASSIALEIHSDR
jgi:hypothetical protein